jgi:hypothetical protein
MKIQITISHNEVTENYSVMSIPSTLVVELNSNKAQQAREYPYLLKTWAQQIWNMKYPNTFGKVIDVQVIN